MTDIERRREYAKDLSPLYLPIYESLCNLLPDQWQPYSGYRSIALQDALYGKGKSISNAPGGASPHNYGCATDWTIFNYRLVLWPEKTDPVWNVYQDACEKAGAKWGGLFHNMVDYYHNELPISVSWAYVKTVLEADGMEAAVGFIKEVMLK